MLSTVYHISHTIYITICTYIYVYLGICKKKYHHTSAHVYTFVHFEICSNNAPKSFYSASGLKALTLGLTAYITAACLKF